MKSLAVSLLWYLVEGVRLKSQKKNSSYNILSLSLDESFAERSCLDAASFWNITCQLEFLYPYACEIWLELLWTTMNWIQIGISVGSPLSRGPEAIYLNMRFWKCIVCCISQGVSWIDSQSSQGPSIHPPSNFLSLSVVSTDCSLLILGGVILQFFLHPGPFLLRAILVPPVSVFLGVQYISVISETSVAHWSSCLS